MITKNETRLAGLSIEQKERQVQSASQTIHRTIEDDKFKFAVENLGAKHGENKVIAFVKLFAVLGGIYGSKWSSHLNNDDAYIIALDQWLKGLSGFTDDEIKLGVERCRNSLDFVITLPRFKFFAKGLYDSNAALELAIKKDFRHFSIKMAHVDCGGERFFRTNSEQDVRYKFRRVYGLICDDIISGKIKVAKNDAKKIEHKEISEHHTWLKTIKNRFPDHYAKWMKDHPEDLKYNI